MSVSPTVRSRLEDQGFCGLDDAALEELAPWIRWTYVLGLLVMLIGVVSTSPAVLWSLAVLTSVGIVLPFHLLYNYGFRYVTGTRPFPNSGPQAAVGVPLIPVATLASTKHFCLPSFIYNTAVDRAGRRRQESAQ